jgi:uncharacterized RDD family membrane protein YckC
MTFETGKKTRDHYASFSRRMWAATIDSMLVLFFVLPFYEMAFSAVYPMPKSTLLTEQFTAQGTEALVMVAREFYHSGMLARWLVDTALQTALLSVLTAICWRYWSATPGKMLLKMKVVDADTEQPMSDQQILLRLLGYVVSSLPFLLGFFWISFDKHRQGWHDKIAGTVVVLISKSDSEAVRP